MVATEEKEALAVSYDLFSTTDGRVTPLARTGERRIYSPHCGSRRG
jgi:hypothetical protein